MLVIRQSVYSTQGTLSWNLLSVCVGKTTSTFNLQLSTFSFQLSTVNCHLCLNTLLQFSRTLGTYYI